MSVGSSADAVNHGQAGMSDAVMGVGISEQPGEMSVVGMTGKASFSGPQGRPMYPQTVLSDRQIKPIRETITQEASRAAQQWVDR